MKLYGITAQVIKKTVDGWRMYAQVPTFFLNADIQGIVSVEHAEHIAKMIIDPAGVLEEVHIVVTPPEDL